MAKQILDDVKNKMDKAIAALQRELAAIRAGRANPAILDRVQVEYYGALTPLNQVANISTPDPRTLVIQPWDKTILGDVEKAIMKSDLGLNPSNDGAIIRISLPALTEERRTELVKLTRKCGEDAKVSIRNIRRDGNEDIKKLEKGDMSEDESRRHQDEIQKLTDRYVDEVDRILDVKEKEIMDV